VGGYSGSDFWHTHAQLVLIEQRRFSLHRLDSPWQNARVEPFNGRPHSELLNSWRFDSPLEAACSAKTRPATTTPSCPWPWKSPHWWPS